MKREVIASKVIFTGKKKYIANVINNEGVIGLWSMSSVAINISFFDPNVNQIYGESRKIIAEEIIQETWIMQPNFLNQALEVTQIS